MDSIGPVKLVKKIGLIATKIKKERNHKISAKIGCQICGHTPLAHDYTGDCGAQIKLYYGDTYKGDIYPFGYGFETCECKVYVAPAPHWEERDVAV